MLIFSNIRNARELQWKAEKTSPIFGKDFGNLCVKVRILQALLVQVIDFEVFALLHCPSFATLYAPITQFTSTN